MSGTVIKTFFFFREGKRGRMGGVGWGREGGRERIPSRFHAQHEADTGVDPTILSS